MRCFIHLDVEAICVCKNCGKAMCVECSAYSGHSGICPECRRDEFIAENIKNEETIKSIRSSFTASIVFAVIFGIASVLLGILLSLAFLAGLILPLILIISALSSLRKIKPLEARIEYLKNEISKLNVALYKGNGVI